ncbi:MAG: S8 family serine peptidase [Deltaproteobacteria bacterium]|nr:S8 family serine peptidase [Deltaproteobacteria bacterium]
MLLFALLSKVLLASPPQAAPLLLHAPDLVLSRGDAILPGYRVNRPLRGLAGWYRVEGPPGLADPTLPLRALAGVRAVSRDQRLSLTGPQDEPSFGDQWALENTSQGGGVWDADVDALDAWTQGASGAGVVIAVIDTGVDLDHPDLVEALWTNQGEVPGNGLDDDGNGYVDDIHGVNTPAGTGDPSDGEGHGTQVAGLIAAQVNGRSTVGLAPDARIMAVRVFGADYGFESDAAEAIAYAVGEGADILSCSWTHGQAPSPVVMAALDLAQDAGVLVVASAGNAPINADAEGYYPARYPYPNLISVAASDRYDRLLHFPGVWGSAWGWETVDLAAPGEWVLTTRDGGGYGAFDGTSASAPLVSAAAALVWSVSPELSALEVKAALLESVDPAGHPTLSGGRLNAGRAVRAALGEAPVDANAAVVALPHGSPEALWVAESELGTAWTWWFSDNGSRPEGASALHPLSPGVHHAVAVGHTPAGAPVRAALSTEVPLHFEPIAGAPVVEPEHYRSGYGAYLLNLGDEAWTRLHFSRVSLTARGLDYQDDNVMVLDGQGYIAWSTSGEAEDLWTPPLRGGQFILAWNVSEESADRSWGFALDGAERSYIPPEGPRPSTDGCATAPPPPWLALLGPLVLSRRRRARTQDATAPSR